MIQKSKLSCLSIPATTGYLSIHNSKSCHLPFQKILALFHISHKQESSQKRSNVPWQYFSCSTRKENTWNTTKTHDFYKVYGYACLYKYDTSKTDEIKVTNLTITFVCECYPHKLIRHLAHTKKYTVSKYENGFYYVNGDIIPIQIIVKKKLSKTENLWLASLTNSLHEKETAQNINYQNQLMEQLGI